MYQFLYSRSSIASRWPQIQKPSRSLKLRQSFAQGSSILAVLMAIFFLSTLLFLSLMRSEAAMKLVKYRYLESIAMDLAENGIEFEKMRIKQTMVAKKGNRSDYNSDFEKHETETIKKTHYSKFDTFAGYAGSFESLFKPLGSGTYEIISMGKLIDCEKKPAFTAKIIALAMMDGQGYLKMTYWSEKCVRHIIER